MCIICKKRIHHLRNPERRRWGYQKGTNYGFENTKAKVLNRDNYTCQCYNGKRKDSKLEVHRIVFRNDGGSDGEDNLITLCHTCHYGVHHGTVKLNVAGQRRGQLKYATQMNSIRCQLLKMYPDAIETFGYVTKLNRYQLGVSKSHHLDACVIASGGNPFGIRQNCVYYKKRVPKGDYQRTKGIRGEQKLPKGKIMGLRKFDKVKYLGSEYFVKGRMSSGYVVLMDIHGNKADFPSAPRGWKTPKLGYCKRISARTSEMVVAVMI